MRLNLAISYGARDEIVNAARRLAERVAPGDAGPRRDRRALCRRSCTTAGDPDPDLLIRTSGEMRISNFMLWQLAYTEMYVTPVLWPDFGREQFFEACSTSSAASGASAASPAT
jgi:undecaprenyl diphosphate synthase